MTTSDPWNEFDRDLQNSAYDSYKIRSSNKRAQKPNIQDHMLIPIEGMLVSSPSFFLTLFAYNIILVGPNPPVRDDEDTCNSDDEAKTRRSEVVRKLREQLYDSSGFDSEQSNGRREVVCGVCKNALCPLSGLISQGAKQEDTSPITWDEWEEKKIAKQDNNSARHEGTLFVNQLLCKALTIPLNCLLFLSWF